ncbi:MAG TPA: tRNA preQ1(34) S-adenosylmethionine ribosyltransferase-isomerase QueA [Terracidiphilus sp.]|nr:tRNA preQ1(34) S-adenosylmethionine ribosyltransferase-isomerase QueA [Terracidiphilus sp.]
MTDLSVADFDYELPEELVAQQPPAERGTSRMLVVDRATGALHDDSFSGFSRHLRPGDLLVLNDSRVIPARLFARRTLRREREKPTGRIEVMLTEPAGESQWRALVRPGRKVAIGERLVFPAPTGEIVLEAEVLERGQFGERLLEFAPPHDPISDDFFAVNFFDILDRIGHVPLPPYIHRDDAQADRDRYQTVFAEARGSVAAPTAGLHFTPEMLASLGASGVEIARVTLHVGLGTFAPLRVEHVDEVRLHSERYSISAQAAAAVNRAVAEGRRIVAVGTTVVRTLEAAALEAGGKPGDKPGDIHIEPHSGTTEIFISPGFEFRLVGALLTNFHLPQSSLLMLVSAFAGREHVLAAYHHAVEQKYRFFSYGDCMFIA